MRTENEPNILRCMCPNARRSSRGYILLAVLAVSVLITTVLATLAKTSLKRAVASGDAQRRLQQRWGIHSLQRTILKRAPKIFEIYDKAILERDPDAELPTSLRQSINMGGVTYDLLLGDEHSKVNLNTIAHARGLNQTERIVKEMVGLDAADSVRLLPSRPISPVNARRTPSAKRQTRR